MQELITQKELGGGGGGCDGCGDIWRLMLAAHPILTTLPLSRMAVHLSIMAVRVCRISAHQYKRQYQEAQPGYK
jgi:hypothetical protein